MIVTLSGGILSVVLLLFLAGCGGIVTAPDVTTISVPSPNYNERRPNFVIIHDTTNDNVERPLKRLTDPAREVSAHYLIGRDGALYQLVAENQRAWHAGQSYWGGLTDLNSSSIGIELDNTGDEAYSEAQIARLLALLRDLKERYRIPEANFLGHGDIAPRRKVDPGRFFPWLRLAQSGFGLWCHEPFERYGVGNSRFDPLLAMQALGYEVVDPAASLQAFRRHFLGLDSNELAVSENEKGLLACLIRQKQRYLTSGGDVPREAPSMQ